MVSPSPSFRKLQWSGVALLACLLLALPMVITPSYLADTFRYSVEVARNRAGLEAPYWEFGHLLWRPWGGFGVTLCGDWFGQWFGDDETRAAARFLIGTSWICSAAGLLLLFQLAWRTGSRWAAGLSIAGLAASNAMLNYSQAGSPYVPAFTFTALAVYLLAPEPARAGGVRRAALAGAAYAIAICLWFPFAFVGLGILACGWFWSGEGDRRRVTVVLLGAMALTTAMFYGYALLQNGLSTPGDFLAWARKADNGWQQRLNLVRAVTGVPRSWFDLGMDTILLKRWFFHDPYQPAGLLALAGSIAWKLAAFYLGLAGFAWGLWRLRGAQPWLWIAAAGFLPLLGFALFVFEPSSTERFLPAFPFLFLSLTAVLAAGGRPAGLAALLPVAMLVANLSGLTGTGAGRRQVSVARLQSIPVAAGGAPALVGVLTLRDEIYQMANVRIFDRGLNDPQRPFFDVIEINSSRSAMWRQEFGRHTRETWSHGGEVWFSERLLAGRPAAEWYWVEGDDPLIAWADIPAFFRQIETDGRVLPGQDGFLRVAPSAHNRSLLVGASDR